MLQRVHIRGYKSLVDVEVELQPLTVLFGPNAAGKSNFLDALQLLSRIPASRTLKEAFEPPYRGKPLESVHFGAGGLEELLERGSVTFSIEADIELSQAAIDATEGLIREMRPAKPGSENGESTVGPAIRERLLRYSIEIEIVPRSGLLRVANESLEPLKRDGTVRKSRNAFLELAKEGDRFSLRMERQGHPTYFKRGLDHSILSLPHYPPHYPHVVAARQELLRYSFFYFEPRERMRSPNPVKEVRHIGLMGEELAAYLNTLKALEPKQFAAVEKSLRTIIPGVAGIDVEVNKLGEVDLWLREDGVRIPARVVSEGTLRVLGLLALGGAKDPPALVGFEEPENGIHPRRIRLLAQLLVDRATHGGTQIIVTTHSPLLADLVPPGSLYACRKVKGRTSIERFEGSALWKRQEIDESLDDENGRPRPSELILRGDLDA
jgi:predicted ATPase